MVYSSGIIVFGKPHCGLCNAAKEKLKLMNVTFESLNMEEVSEPHPGWRTDGSVDVVAFYHAIGTLPVIKKDGKLMTYPELMKNLKSGG